jgi:hypothetical protein
MGSSMYPLNSIWSRLSLAVLLLLAPSNMLASTLFKAAVPFGTGSDISTFVTVGDLNGDGKPDLVIANHGDYLQNNETISVLLGNGDGTFQAAQTHDFAGVPNGMALADVDGDGKLDLLVAMCSEPACDGGGLVGVLLGNGDGTFHPLQTYSSGGDGANAIAVADVNQDGKLDVLVGNSCQGDDCASPDGIAVLLGNGNGTFQSPQIFSSGAWLPSSIVVTDVNGDGKLDLLVAHGCNHPLGQGCSDGVVGVLLGNGNGTFGSAQTFSSGSYFATSLAVADVNADGKLDLLVADECTNFTNNQCADKSGIAAVFLGNGDGTFQPPQIYKSGGNSAESISVADVTGDGKLDLIVVNGCGQAHRAACSSGGVGVLVGNGDGTFLPAQTSPSGGDEPESGAVADINGDSKPDIVVCNTGPVGNVPGPGTVGVLLGKAKYNTSTNLTSGPNPSVVGQLVTLTASVASVGPLVPTGSVTFKNGGTVIGSAKVSGGVARLNTSKLPAGTLSLTASYNGDVKSAKSTSGIVVQVVNPAGR